VPDFGWGAGALLRLLSKLRWGALLLPGIVTFSCLVPGIEIDSELGDDGDGGMCAKSDETDECFVCQDEKCCKPHDTCQKDPRCVAFYTECLPTCTNVDGKSFAECVVECDGKYHAGHVGFAPLQACVIFECTSECGGTPKSRCDVCLRELCGVEHRACLTNADCDTLSHCVTLCNSNLTCVETCRSQETTRANEELDVFLRCGEENCATECG
jgi:hypothetical protein